MGQKLRLIQPVFNKGELSPRLKGRVDNQAYYKAYDEGLNMEPFPEGGMTFRHGSVFVSEVKDSTKTTILTSFRFSTVQNYILEFGDQYVRFYRNRGQIESGGSPYEVATPYLEADLRELWFYQSADVLFILHPDYQPRKLIRTSDTSWSLDLFEFEEMPYYPINSTATTLSISSSTVTASTNVFQASDVGRTIRIKDGSAWIAVEIATYSSPTSVTVSPTGHTISSTTSWRLSAFGGGEGWPAKGTIYEERMMFGNTVNQPSTIWGSRTADYGNFRPSDPDDGVVSDDDGFVFTIANDQVNAITWLSGGRILLIGTTGGEYSLTGGSSSGYAPVTPSNVTIKRESNYGAKNGLKAHRVGNAVLYFSQSATKVREIYYEFGIDSYISRDTTLFNEHVLRKGVVDSCYVNEPDPNLWTCTDDGKLVGMIYERQQEIEGWHRHQIGGVNSKVESVASIPRPADEKDDLWMIVSRTIDGSTKRYVEYKSEIFEDVIAPIDGVAPKFYAKYLDSCLTYDGYLDAGLTFSATTGSVTVTADASVFDSGDIGKEIRFGSGKAVISAYASATEVDATVSLTLPQTTASAGEWSLASDTFSGLDHLEGQTVGIQVDGAITDDQVVSSGQITLADGKASVVHIGLKYTGFIKLLPPEELQLGTIQGREKSLIRLFVYVTDTYGLKVNDSTTDETDTIKFLKFPLVTNQAPSLKTGLIACHPPSGYERDSQIKLVHDTATPFVLNYVIQELDVNS